MTASELAKEWREERLQFDDAILCHLVENLGLRPEEALVVGIGMAISYVNMGLSDVALDLPGCQPMTAEEIVTKFGLEPVLEAAE